MLFMGMFPCSIKPVAVGILHYLQQYFTLRHKNSIDIICGKSVILWEERAATWQRTTESIRPKEPSPNSVKMYDYAEWNGV